MQEKMGQDVITITHIIQMLDILDEYLAQNTHGEITRAGWSFIQSSLYLITNELKIIVADVELFKDITTKKDD